LRVKDKLVPIHLIIGDESIKLLTNQYKCHKTDETLIIFLNMSTFAFNCYSHLFGYVNA